MATFSTVVRRGNRWKSWNTKPIVLQAEVGESGRPESAQMSLPSISTLPALGRRMPEIMLSSVVLPLPEGPTM